MYSNRRTKVGVLLMPVNTIAYMIIINLSTLKEMFCYKTIIMTHISKVILANNFFSVYASLWTKDSAQILFNIFSIKFLAYFQSVNYTDHPVMFISLCQVYWSFFTGHTVLFVGHPVMFTDHLILFIGHSALFIDHPVMFIGHSLMFTGRLSYLLVTLPWFLLATLSTLSCLLVIFSFLLVIFSCLLVTLSCLFVPPPYLPASLSVTCNVYCDLRFWVKFRHSWKILKET